MTRRALRQAQHAARLGRSLTPHQRLRLAGFGEGAAFWLARWVGEIALVTRERRPGRTLVLYDGRLYEGRPV